MNKVIVWLGTGFGFGFSPFAPGTVGMLWGIPLLYVLRKVTGDQVGMQIIICMGLTLLSIPICHVAEKNFGKKDARQVVADEYLTFPIAMIGLPMHPAMIATAFVTTRIFDILKPPPANGLQSLKGGLGITIDDFIATLYALALNWALFWIWSRYGHVLLS